MSHDLNAQLRSPSTSQQPVLPNCTKDLVAALDRLKVKSIFVTLTSWDTHDHNNLHHPILLCNESTYSMHSMHSD
jgi:hypothetical protein